MNAHQEEYSIYNKKYYYHNPFLNLEKHPRIFVQLSLQTSKRDHLEKVKITPQQGQHLGQSSETIFLLMEIIISNLKPHLIREIQKNPN